MRSRGPHTIVPVSPRDGLVPPGMRSFFQFAFRCSDGSTRFIVAETKSSAQADCMTEVIDVGLEKCILLATFTNCASVTLANEAFVVVGFAEFMADMAGFDSMPRGLQERIADAAAGGEEPELAAKPATAGQSDKLVTALTGLGFGVKSVKKWVQSLGPKAETRDLPSLVKDGVKALVSAPAN
jgi:hypothetical protein